VGDILDHNAGIVQPLFTCIRTHLVEHPKPVEDVIKSSQVPCPAGGDVPRWHVHAKIGVVVGGCNGAGVVLVDVCGFTPLRAGGHSCYVACTKAIECSCGGGASSVVVQCTKAVAVNQ
jgi:hypothetical protein